MAHLESYTKKDIKKVIREHDRTAKTYKNDVDPNRTHLNWSYKQFTAEQTLLNIQSRCMDITSGKKLQEQTNIMTEWCITYPFTECIEKTCVIKKNNKEKKKKYYSPVDMEHCKQFFDTAYKFVTERYGSENIVCAYVHMDETSPQLHVAFVPEATSRKNGKRTVSSASLATRKELRMFHQDLQKRMNDVFGENDYILNGRTKGNYTTDELKERTEQERRLERKAKMLDKAFQKVQEALEELDDIKASYDAVIGVKTAPESRENEYRAFLQRHKLKSGKTLLEKFQEEQQQKQQYEIQAEANRVSRRRNILNALNNMNKDEDEYEL